MEREQQTQDDAGEQDDESVEDFKREIEEDPSMAPADDPELERERGG